MQSRMMALAAAVVMLAIGAGAVRYASAQEGGTPAEENTPARGEAFIDKVAANLGVTPDALKQAFRDASLQTVDEAETDGRITAEQADKARERIENAEGPGLRGFFHRQYERREHAVRALGQSVAGALGITPAELRAELQASDVSIADLAVAHGVAVEDVKAAVLADADAKLEEAVANGRIMQVRADELLSKLEGRIDEALSKTR
ncbi:MAG: hypothetical protein WEC75_09980 [Dehalococcoidia bacterium]